MKEEDKWERDTKIIVIGGPVAIGLSIIIQSLFVYHIIAILAFGALAWLFREYFKIK